MRFYGYMAVVLAGVLAAPNVASAFCGFYVSGADAKLFNNATQVVLMRHGKRTVLSMQNNYQGPPNDFAMVIPVPVVLQKENVKTLPAEIFKRVDSLAAPRLVEYWEKDPCQARRDRRKRRSRGAPAPAEAAKAKESKDEDLGVTIEAQFKVGEYEIVILSAKDSGGLDTWLRRENYKIPTGAEPLFRPYIQSGMKFFVAKVDSKKVTFKEGMAMLSPLRFHYDTDEFSLPIRLGLVNAKDKQDLIVHILSPRKRYEVANYKNVTIPTNLDVKDEARTRFGEFYAALFDRTLERNPGAVITEYSWDASTCDPCPTPGLRPAELATLGMDVLYQQPSAEPVPAKPSAPPGRRKPGTSDPLDLIKSKKARARRRPSRPRWRRSGLVLTRLHARYSSESAKDDLIFREADPIAGGREVRRQGVLEQGSSPSRVNNFQGRYAIRHEWTGPVPCDNPVRGRWGGPPASERRRPGVKPALDLAFAPRGKTKLVRFVNQDIPELSVTAKKPTSTPTSTGAPPVNNQDKPKKSKGCDASGNAGAFALAVAFLLSATARRRRTQPKE